MKHIHTFEDFLNEANKFKSTKDFLDFLEEIDGMKEGEIRKIMGKDYIDTPGNYKKEAKDYDNDIEEYMISNMGKGEFEKLLFWWGKNVQESIINEDDINESLNEGDEVQPEKIMSAAQKKALKNVFENTITGVDKITFKRDGTIVAKRGYFYRHGMDENKMADKLVASLKAEGIEIEVVDKYDDWNAWPKDSNMVVVFKLK